jgi:hypothetical protein
MLVAVIVMSAAIGLAPPAGALLDSCGARQTSTPFAPWADFRAYFLMPGGGFERGAAAWSLSGGSVVVMGNESYFANAKTDKSSLRIPGGAQVVSPTICVTLGETGIRLFVKNSGVSGSVLHVQAYVGDPLTGLTLSTGFDVNGVPGSTDWSPSPPLLVPNLLGGLLGTEKLTLVFSTKGAPATWGIDDVFVDPFKSR